MNFQCDFKSSFFSNFSLNSLNSFQWVLLKYFTLPYEKTKTKGRNGGIIKESQQKEHLKNLKKIMDTILIAERRIPVTSKYHF